MAEDATVHLSSDSAESVKASPAVDDGRTEW